MESILNLENWRKFGNDWVGYYIYPIASKVAYEIVINFHYLDTPNNNNPKYYKDSVNCSIFYIPINKIITKWLINNICYYIHINRTKNAHLRIYK